MKLILGPLPCHTCRQPVHVVRRDVEQPCLGDDVRYRTHFDGVRATLMAVVDAHTHTIPDVGPFTTVDADGTRHECAA